MTDKPNAKEYRPLKWHPHVKFAMPGVIALFFVAVFQTFIPPHLRPWALGSVGLTLVLGLATGQFHWMAKQKQEKESPPNTADPEPDREDTPE
jgi:hypothetical protein